ncbi:PucR family transcriptional regulator [Euzebya sp.]|uniref:PucR family transcriptional regulator n=1 Tax=Euzebya sp. TaxID=1971409 RepID=UPI00351347B9
MSQIFDPSRHADTVAPGGRVRVGARPTARLAAKLMEDMEAVTDEVVEVIRGRLPGYAAGPVPRSDLWWSVRVNVEVTLRAIAEDRSLRADEVAERAVLGTRRARQEMAVTHVIQAYQVGYIAVWRLLTDAAKAAGQEAVDDLVDVAGHFWAMMHLVSASVAEAYHEASRERGSEVRRRALVFMDLLRELPEGAAVARDEARALGLDPDADIVAGVRRPEADDDPLRLREAGIVLVERQDSVVLLTNTADESLAFAAQRGPIGIGMARPGLEAALESVRDAQQAFDAARLLGRPVVRFRDDWFACVLAGQLHRLHHLVKPAVDVLEADPLMAETVRAYLDNDGRLGAAGQSIHVHANTVGYRLDRFADRTGCDPRTTAGQFEAALALLIAGPEG